MTRTAVFILTIGVCLSLAGCLTGSGGNDSKQNLLDNGAFEIEENGRPEGWQDHTWGDQASFDHLDAGRKDSRCVAVASQGRAAAAWFETVPAIPFAEYKLTGWIRVENVTTLSGRGALLNIHGLPTAQTAALAGTGDWRRVAVTFTNGDLEELQVNCLLGGWGLASGRALYDDIRLELLSAPETATEAAAIRIDAARAGTPISKYIYGQFIEHLGRCIYGGIWAEMLEDRKFFDAVGEGESPWTMLGGGVMMVRGGAYAGDQMPRILAAPGRDRGLVQRGLGLETGRDYTGRIVLAATEGVSSVRVSLHWDKGAGHLLLEDLEPGFATYPLRFTAGGSSGNGQVVITAEGKGHVDIGAVSLMPEDNVHGMRADTLALLKELNAPLYRWPGGNFVSGYDWRDGIGDPDRRPPRKNPAWKGIEHNDFGIDEFLRFCRFLDTEPLVVVNSGLGGVEMALAQLEYCNGGPGTPMGQRRAENGHADPYTVAWWGVGNEMYGNWQLGHMPLEEYVAKHNDFAGAMRRKDPGINIVAVGATGPWSETMLRECADRMDLLSEHFYCGEAPSVVSHVRQIGRVVEHKAAAHRRYHREIPALAARKIPIAMDEWNYWYGDHVYGELGTRYYLKDALGIAQGLHAFYRASDVVFMANYAQTVNVIGCIKTTKTDAAFATTGLVLKLYRAAFGILPVETATTGYGIDAMAAWTEAGDAITLGVVNAKGKPIEIELDMAGVPLGNEAQRWVITGPGPKAYNTPGETSAVAIREEAVCLESGHIEAPPFSVCLYRFPAAREHDCARLAPGP